MSFLTDNYKEIVADIKDNKEFFSHNHKIFKCMKGDQLSVLKDNFSNVKSARAKQDRIDLAISLNYIQTIVNKLSMLYTFEVSRTPTSNQDLVDFYSNKLNIDSVMQSANELYNGMKSVLVEIYQKKDKQLAIRPIPNDRFFVWSNDLNEPNIPNVFIKILGMAASTVDKNNKVEVYLAYTDEEWLKFDSDGVILGSDVNVFGISPFVYINKDAYDILPTPNKDLLQNVLQICTVMTDANVANFWQANPTRVLTNADLDDLTLDINPNSIVVLNAKPGSTLTPDFKEVPSSLDTSKSIALAKTILEQLLFTYDIQNDGAIQDSTSGIALAIKNVATLENRKRQIEFFETAERDLWNKIALMHNNMMKRNDINPKTPKKMFEESFEIEVEFELPSAEVEQKNASSADGQSSSKSESSVKED